MRSLGEARGVALSVGRAFVAFCSIGFREWDGVMAILRRVAGGH